MVPPWWRRQHARLRWQTLGDPRGEKYMEVFAPGLGQGTEMGRWKVG